MTQPSCIRHMAARAIAAVLLGPLAAGAAAGADAHAHAQILIDLNPLLSGHAVQVQAVSGGLRLEGAVADEHERRLAAALTALVADGAEIDNALTLDADLPVAPDDLFTRNQDETTAARLRQRLAWQTDTAGLDIEVEVNRGEVRLNGEVGTTAAKDRIAALAATTEGVDEVFNYIGVDPGRIADIRETQAAQADVSRPDAWIASRLRRLLAFDTTVNARSIKVEARDGTAILSGAVTSSAERMVAEDLAAQVPGVGAVDSRLIIEHPR